MSKPKTEYGHGFLLDDKAQLPPYEYCIREKDKGLFVIINNYLYKYWHHLEQGQKPIKLDSMESVFMHVLEMLRKTFKISKGHSNVAYERNLVAKNSVGIEER